jgi:hypothetical protein
LDQDSIDDAEYCGIRADAESKGEDRHQGECRSSNQGSPTETNVLPQRVDLHVRILQNRRDTRNPEKS